MSYNIEFREKFCNLIFMICNHRREICKPCTPSTHVRMTNLPSCQRWASATYFWVCNCNSATRTKHFRNRNSATLKEMLLRNRNSAIPQSQFFFESATSIRNLRASLPQCSAHFWPWNPVDSWRKKIGDKKSRATVPLRQVFCFQRNREF